MTDSGIGTPYMKGSKPLTVVIKLGTSSIVDEQTHEPLLSILTLIVETAVKLRKDGHKVIIVSSGAIGVGLRRMNVSKRPKHLSKLQALAAIGQCRLISLWDSLFAHLQQPVSQILLTRNDIADRSRYLNAQNTMAELLDMGVIPIVNENDTLAVAEIKFGDNDTLSAITAAMVHADFLFLMTDVDCLYDKNPRTHPDARPIEEVDDIGAIQADVSSAGSSLGTGGMGTKIVAARLATSAGVTTIITRSSSPGNIVKIVRYLQGRRGISTSASQTSLSQATHAAEESSAAPTISAEKPPLHTRFLPMSTPIRDRYFWLLHGIAPHGTLYIDAGAHAALSDKAGLLPVGVLDVEGNFAQQEAVRLVVVDRRAASPPALSSPSPSCPTTRSSTPVPVSARWEACHPVEVGRALVNYAAPEIARIKGHRSAKIGELLGYADSEYVAHRENISLFRRESRPVSPAPDLAANIGGVAGYEAGGGTM
ncbi:putative glutamate 5-kinase [Rosellinia necatrix]|uniref:Putative glutamate 5-kinase n=1 Tax=Rosellinia necatrix TaxID=77044 RepID=A0A1W2TLU8_ROSNE|nr:putative glutamate 5-kinase [Rosellinia necatrix]